MPCLARVSRRWQNPALVVATLIFLVVVGEGLARGKAILFPETQGFPTHSGNLWHRKYVRLNSRGFRDEERTIHAGEGVRRVLIVGDSYTFGTGVKDPQGRFGELLEARLNEHDTRHWEAINAGQGDTHTLQHMEFLSRMLDLQPELVVLIYVFNDIDYLASVTPRDNVASSKMGVGRVLFLNSYLFQELYVRLRKIWLARANEARFSPYDNSELMSQHFADLSRFVSMASEAGAAVRIVPYAFNIEQPERTRYTRFIQQAMEFGLPICSLEGAFEGNSLEALRVNSLDGHPNAHANGIAVEATFSCLVESLHATDQ